MAIENLLIPSFADANILEETVLASDVAVGATSAVVANPQNFADDNFICFDPETETAEIRRIDATVTTPTLTLNTATLIGHLKRSRVIKLFGDQVRVYRAANVNGYVPDDSDFSSLGSPVDIDADQGMTSFTDSSGGSGYWYKFTYYNSLSTAETSLTRSPAVRGGSVGHYVTIEDIRQEAGLSQVASLKDSLIAARRSQSESLVDGACASAGYTMPLQDVSGAEFTPEIVALASTLIAAGYVLSKDFGPAAGEAGEEAAKDGRSKVKQGMDILKKLANNEIMLLDSNKVSLLRTTQVAGWPDNTTKDVGTDGVTGQPYQMSMSKVF